MVTNEDDLLASKNQWNHALRLSGLRRLIDENIAELHLG
jgi:hypothetical protein